jgi:hypothetical protein
MNCQERVAHHEAAHVVMSYLCGGGPTLHGIDITAPSSAPGAFGNAGVGKLIHDQNQPEEDQRKDLLRNVAIICAGAACDAQTLDQTLDMALQMQPGDLAAARAEIAQSPLLPSPGLSSQEELDERELVLRSGLETAQHRLARPEVWNLVEKVARACLDNGGKLSKNEIEALLTLEGT